MTTNLLYLFHLTKAKLRKRLLVYFFAHPEANLYLREIAHLIQVDPANLSRELQFLEKEGIFQSYQRGLQKFFSLNHQYPLFNEMKKIIEHSIGGELATPQDNRTIESKTIAPIKQGSKKNPPALAKKAERALREAVYDTFQDHARTGDYVAIWENGKVVKVPASKLHLKEPAARYRGKKKPGRT